MSIRLGTDRTVREYIPPLLKAENQLLRTELSSSHGHVAVIFDGTPRIAEQTCVLVRYCVKDRLIPQQRILSLKVFEGSLSGMQWAAHVNRTLTKEYKVDCDNILFTNQDRAEANAFACRNLEAIYHPCLVIPCIAHTLDKIGGFLLLFFFNFLLSYSHSQLWFWTIALHTHLSWLMAG